MLKNVTRQEESIQLRRSCEDHVTGLYRHVDTIVVINLCTY